MKGKGVGTKESKRSSGRPAEELPPVSGKQEAPIAADVPMQHFATEADFEKTMNKALRTGEAFRGEVRFK